jgi:hypothetical protein
MGTARMGDDPRTSVTDEFGRVHALDNLYFADGSVFVSAGGFNPTVTIMALALRSARSIAGAGAAAQPVVAPKTVLPVTGAAPPLVGAAAATAAAIAASATIRQRDRQQQGGRADRGDEEAHNRHAGVTEQL